MTVARSTEGCPPTTRAKAISTTPAASAAPRARHAHEGEGREDGGGEEGDVEARHREEVVDAGAAKALVRLARERGALAEEEPGEERRRRLGQLARRMVSTAQRLTVTGHGGMSGVRAVMRSPRPLPDEEDAVAAELGRVVEAAGIPEADGPVEPHVCRDPLPLGERLRLAEDAELDAARGETPVARRRGRPRRRRGAARGRAPSAPAPRRGGLRWPRTRAERVARCDPRRTRGVLCASAPTTPTLTEQRQGRQALAAPAEGGRGRTTASEAPEAMRVNGRDGEPRGERDPERQRGGEREQGRAGPVASIRSRDQLADHGELLRTHAEHVAQGVGGLEAAAALPLGQDAPGQALARRRAGAPARRGSRG